MFKLSTASRYGLRALVYLAQNKDCRSAAEISKNEKIPKAYLEKILVKLNKAGLVKVSHGAQGGYKLAQTASKIKIAKALSALETQKQPTCHFIDGGSCTCGGSGGCAVKNLEQYLEDEVLQMLNKITLKNLI